MTVSLWRCLPLSHTINKKLTFYCCCFFNQKIGVYKYINTMGQCDAALLTTFPYHRYNTATSNASFSVDSVRHSERR